MHAANKGAPNFIFKNVLQHSDTGLLQYFNLIKNRSSEKLNRETLDLEDIYKTWHPKFQNTHHIISPLKCLQNWSNISDMNQVSTNTENK